MKPDKRYNANSFYYNKSKLLYTRYLVEDFGFKFLNALITEPFWLNIGNSDIYTIINSPIFVW